MYRVRSTGEIKNASEIRSMNPNVSMPKKFTAVTCDALGIDLVKPSARPEPTGTYTKVVKNGYEQVNGSWQVAWSEVDMFTANDSQTKAEQEAAHQADLDAALRADQIMDIEAVFSEQVKQITAGYSEDEIKTWDKQAAEAEAFTADATTPTPLLDAIAAVTGDAKGDLVGKVITKANAYSAAVGAALGAKQKAITLL